MKKIFLVLIVLTLYGCNTTKIIEPLPTNIPANLTKDEVYSAIIVSLKDAPKVPSSVQKTGDDDFNWMDGAINSGKQYWHYEGQDNDVVHAGFYYKRFYIRADVTYGKDYIKYTIVDSRNLKQTNGRIHGKAYTWLALLEGDVRMALGRIDGHKR